MTEIETTDTYVTVRRTIDASTERVFDAWLDPEEIERWMFPSGTDEVVAIDVDPLVGGSFSFKVRRDGDVIDHVGQYEELDRPNRLAFTWGIVGDEGEDLVTVEVTAIDAGCEVTLTHELHPDWIDFADRTAEAWTMMLDALADHLGEGDQ